MEKFRALFDHLREYQQLEQAVTTGETPISAAGLSAVHRAALIHALVQGTGKTAFVLTADEPSAIRLCDDINTLLGDGSGVYFPAREYVYRKMDSVSHEYEHQRLSILGKLQAGQVRVLVASVESASQYTMSPEAFRSSVMTLQAGEGCRMEDIMAFLVAKGYNRREQVEGICQFAQRGGILDFFPPHLSEPIRVEFWGEEIDTISSFAVDTQRRIDNMEQVEIPPAHEVLFESVEQMIALLQKQAALLGGKNLAAKQLLDQDAQCLADGMELVNLDRFLPLLYPDRPTILDYMGDCMVFACEPASIKENSRSFFAQHHEDIKIMLEDGLLFGGCTEFYASLTDWMAEAEKHPFIILDSFTRTALDVPLKGLLDIHALQLAPWSGEYAILREDLDDFLVQNYCVILFAGTERAAHALVRDLQQDDISCEYCTTVSTILPRKVFVMEGSLSAGMDFPDLKLAVLSHRGTVQKVKPKVKKKGTDIKSISDLAVGDYVVHVSHGIGIFGGIVKREIQGVTKDYIQIRYAGTDMLFVPVTQLDLVTKYIGGKEDSNVKLNKLNSAEWNKTRQRVRHAVKDMAEELTKLYALRMQSKGFAFSQDTDWQNDFERRFPFEETDDQLRCVDEIKQDMEGTIPMDRLLCGDVGFGKTEVALRAVFKCVMDSKQCAVLVPTTILAWQHFQSFKKRMDGFPIKVELLSRFRTPRQQEEILRELRRGEIDVIIGTHRIVQKDVAFKDLGLCIIDEEQRFGVAHKERFKELRNDVDVLTLSATPIPRTLSMAMSGIRDMSLIEEAPQDRIPVQTYVMEHDWGVIRQAINKELRRGGQVFYLHNRVETIDRCATTLQDLVPEARIVTAHGKMGEEQLSRVWKRLVDNEIDILVCTTIIETGVDVPNCNTLIIENADNMGLSQLYQIRGRVGRSSRRAYAYMTFTRGKALTDVATKRLGAIKEFTTFGSGFRIAMRDLEIRGAGSILGAKQHGHMEAVGYEMYLKMLSDAVAISRGETPKSGAEECLIDVRIEAHIPERYIENLNQRIDIYKKIAAIQCNDDASDLVDELIDRFGEPPKAVQGLIDVALLRGTAARLGISEISQRDQGLILTPEHFDMEKASLIAANLRGRVMVNAGTTPYISVKIMRGETALDVMKMALAAMEK